MVETTASCRVAACALKLLVRERDPSQAHQVLRS
jgi:hypothetical protein